MPGAALTSLVADIDPALLASDVEAIDLAIAWDRVASWAQARGLRAVAEFVRRPDVPSSTDPVAARAGRRPLGQVGRWHPEAEVGAAMSLSPQAAQMRVATACTAVRVFPATLGALECGRIDGARLAAMIDEAGGCDAAAARAVEAAVLAHGGRTSASRFRQAVRRQVARQDPEGCRRRENAARQDTFVRTRPESLGTAWVEAYLPAEDVAAVRAVLDAAAATLRGRDGEDRTTAQLRGAALVAPFWAALATGTLTTPAGQLRLASAGGQTPAVELVVHRDGSADLVGLGPVSADLVGQIGARGTAGARPVVRVSRPEPDHARQVAREWPVEPGYRPSAALTRLVRERDGGCRFPGCSAQALRADLDHTTPWPDGPTHPANLAVLCRRHHRVKHTPGFRLRQGENGQLTWTLPTGHTHTTGPPHDRD